MNLAVKPLLFTFDPLRISRKQVKKGQEQGQVVL
jgi:hypothetical protein